jgi:hypothetical protein
VGLPAPGHSRSPLLAPAAAWATFASHAVKGGNDQKQEAHADSHSHDGHSSLGGLGSYCRDRAREAAQPEGPGAPHTLFSPLWGYSPELKWKTCLAFPRALVASQETPSRLRALVTFKVR